MPPWPTAFITTVFHSSGDDSEYMGVPWDSHRQWVSDTSTSGTLSTTSEDQTTQEADEWQECALAGTEKRGCWEITECYSHLLLSLLFLTRRPKPADAVLTAQPELAPAQGAGSRAAPAQRQTGVLRGLCTWVRSAHTHTPWHPCAGHLLVKTVMKTCHCSAICSSS